MKIKNKTTKKTKVFFGIVVLLTIGVIVYFIIKNIETSYYGEDRSSKSTADKKKKNNDNSSTKTTSGSDRPPSPTPSSSGGKSEVSTIISANNQNGSVFQIRALIQTVVSDGTCTLNGTSASGKTVQKTSGVQPQPSTSTCQGFEIPVSELSQESWNFTISFENSSLRGSASKEVVIN